MNTYQFPPIYRRSIRWALICQFCGVMLAAFILDTGIFALQFFCLSLIFWVFVGVLMFTRRRPTVVERLFIATGPMLIFWTRFFIE